MIRTHSSFLESSYVLFIRTHRLVTENPADWQVRVDNDTEPDSGHVVEIGAGFDVPERCNEC